MFGKFTLSLFLLFSFISSLSAQHLIKGTVQDESGEALQGVNVFLPVSFEGEISDSLGRFQFGTKENFPLLLRLQYLGYRADSILIPDAAAAQNLRLRMRQTAAALSEIVVTAGAFVASDTRKTAVLSSIDVATTGSTADIAQALATLPGVTPAPESGQLMVRGGDAAETQAFINGLRVPRLYTGTVQDVPARVRFSPFSFEGITFASGGFSAAYGDALSGALLLQTPLMPDQTLSSISLMTVGAGVSHTQLLSNQQAFAVDLSISHLGLYVPLREETRRTLDRAPQNAQLSGGYWWQSDKGASLRIISQWAGQRFAGTDSSQMQFYGTARRGLENLNGFNQAVFQQELGNDGLINIGLVQGSNHDVLSSDQGRKRLLQQDWQLRASYSDSWNDRALWRVGAETQLRSEKVEIDTNEWMRLASNQQEYAAGFAEADWFWQGRWVLRTGLRAESYDGSTPELSPRTQLSYLFSGEEQIALSAGRYLQRQMDERLFALDARMEAAEAHQVGLTYSKSWKERILRVEAYAKTYDRLFSIAEDASMGSEGHGFARGLDFFFRDRSSIPNSDFWISYSFLHAARKRADVRELAPVPFGSPHNLSLVAKRFFPARQFGINLTYQWHAGRAYDDPNREARFDRRTPHFHNVSANLTWLTNVQGHFTVVFISLSNITGARQIGQYRFSQTPDPQTGLHERLEVDPIWPRFPFAGMFISIGDRDRKGTVDDI